MSKGSRKRATARAYLSTTYYIRLDMQKDEEHMEALRHAASGLKGIRYDKDRVQTSPVNQTEEIMAELDEIERRYAERLSALHRDIQRKTDEINTMHDKLLAEILKRRYLSEDPESLKMGRRTPFEKIAYDLSLTYSYVRQKHMDALGAFYDEVLKRTNTNEH